MEGVFKRWIVNKSNGTAYHYLNKSDMKAKYTFGEYTTENTISK